MTTKAIVKAELLVWARERAKVTAKAAAKAVNVKPETLAEWEAGAEAPTLNQLRALATCYRFPLAVFYLPKPPKDFAPLRDFRRLPDADSEEISPNLAYHIRSAYERRELALELHEGLQFLRGGGGNGRLPGWLKTEIGSGHATYYFRQDLYFAERPRPFLIVHWRHAFGAIRILDVIPGDGTQAISE